MDYCFCPPSLIVRSVVKRTCLCRDIAAFVKRGQQKGSGDVFVCRATTCYTLFMHKQTTIGRADDIEGNALKRADDIGSRKQTTSRTAWSGKRGIGEN